MKIRVILVGSNEIVEFNTANDWTIDADSETPALNGALRIWKTDTPGQCPPEDGGAKESKDWELLGLFPAGSWVLILDEDFGR